MAAQRVIVGIGELMLIEEAGAIDVTGIAARAAVEAVRFGHRGIAISRLGQDDDAKTVIERLRERGVHVDCLQSDPDHATGRMVVRSILGRVTRQMNDRAAYDYLQWDYDLEDTAQIADIVFFGCLARRTALARSTIERMLGMCNRALRVFDLTNRWTSAVDGDNGQLADELAATNPQSGLRYADLVVIDAPALRIVWPAGRSQPVDAAMHALMRHHDVHGALLIDVDRPPQLFSRDQTEHASDPWPASVTQTGVTACMLALLGGASPRAALDAAQRAINIVKDDPDATIDGGQAQSDDASSTPAASEETSD